MKQTEKRLKKTNINIAERNLKGPKEICHVCKLEDFYGQDISSPQNEG